MKIQVEDSYMHADYVQLNDLSQEARSRATGVLDALALEQEDIALQPLKALLAKEMSFSRHFRWAVIDNLIEKILQGCILNKQDISQEAINFCTGMVRQVPSGRSLLLHQAFGLKKVYAARGLVLTTEMALTKAVKIFIAVSLSYRLYNGFTTGNTDFVEFRAIFDNNSKKGVSSLARLLLANFEPEWLYLLLTSPAIVGVLKGLWDTRRSQPLTESAIMQLQEAVNHHTNALLKNSYLWGDVLRQMIPIPGFSSVSERVQKAEQQVRWDGRITNEQRASLFSHIERLALQGSGISKINAMQSLAKIVHSLSIKDFPQLQQAGYPQETLVQILRIKTQALRDLNMLSNRARIQPEAAQQNPLATLNQSLVSMLYANYLLWWLGIGKLKHLPLFWSFKLGKLALEGLFVKALVESILEVINCPDKKGFRMFFGDFELWANDLTSDCFYEFVRQFRSIYKEEPFESFLEQLNNFDLRAVESVNLASKALTSNEARKILNILNKRASIKLLNLGGNEINETMGLLFPNSLQSLYLSQNDIDAGGLRGLQLPSMLTFLDLSYNYDIGDEGVKDLVLPPTLQSLHLDGIGISDEGAKRLQLPSMLTYLSLFENDIGVEGAKGLQIPSKLQSLNLGWNKINNEGAKGLSLPSTLRFLGIAGNQISAEGIKELQLPAMLTSLELYGNDIGDEGLRGLQFSSMLQDLYLGYNNISDAGTQGLRLPSMLQTLELSGNHISTEGVKGLQLLALSSLTFLNLGSNNIDAEGIEELQFPSMLQTLWLGGNNIGAEGAKRLQLLSLSLLEALDLGGNNLGAEGVKGLQLPAMLTSLELYGNNIGDELKGLQFSSMLQYLGLNSNNIGYEGVRDLQLPSMLKSLSLDYNNISDEGAKELQLPLTLTYLSLDSNNIGNEGANALLEKIFKTKFIHISLRFNLYNSTAINPNRTLQQQQLLQNCRSQLCNANTPLWAQDEPQTSGATRAQSSLLFSWLKKPLAKLSEYASGCVSSTLDSLGARLEKIVSHSPSYFPNIRSSEINDWQPSESAMLHQFKASGSGMLLLSAAQTTIQPSLRSIAR